MQKKLLSWVFLFAMAAAAAIECAAQGTQAGRIVLARINGAVTLTLKADGSVRPAINNEQIAAGYIVTTAPEASVVLIFSNGATVNLRGDSVLDIETFLQDPFAEDFKIAAATAEPTTSTTRLNLTRGELIGNVKKLNADGGSSFNIQTPVGAAGIRGTTFRIIFRPDGAGQAAFSITTIEGLVVLTQGGVEVPIDATDGVPREVSVVVAIQIDPVTGVITVQLGGQTFTAQVAPAATTAAIMQAMQQIVQAVALQVFSAPSNAPGQGQGQQNALPTNESPPEPPPALPPAPRTTTGDGTL